LACLAHLWLYNSPAVSVVATLSAGVILVLFSHSSRILAFFGNFSYSVYLIHPVIGSTFINVCSHYVSGSFAKFMLVLAGAAITAAGSYLMYRWVEKPSKALSTRLKYK
jgi:peptidoglycan/LPS O-acetylase OafA/YrhL